MTKKSENLKTLDFENYALKKCCKFIRNYTLLYRSLKRKSDFALKQIEI